MSISAVDEPWVHEQRVEDPSNLCFLRTQDLEELVLGRVEALPLFEKGILLKLGLDVIEPFSHFPQVTPHDLDGRWGPSEYSNHSQPGARSRRKQRIAVVREAIRRAGPWFPLSHRL